MTEEDPVADVMPLMSDMEERIEGLACALEILRLADTAGTPLSILVGGATLLIASSINCMHGSISRREVRDRLLLAPQQRFDDYVASLLHVCLALGGPAVVFAPLAVADPLPATADRPPVAAPNDSQRPVLSVR